MRHAKDIWEECDGTERVCHLYYHLELSCWRNIVTTCFVIAKGGATIAKHTATISKIRSQKLTENS